VPGALAHSWTPRSGGFRNIEAAPVVVQCGVERRVRVALGAALGMVALIGLGAADAAAFEARASALEQRWRNDERAGVPAASYAPARLALERLRSRRILALPYPIVSGALVIDPLGRPEQLGAAAHERALADARRRAEAALSRLQELGGPNYAATAREERKVLDRTDTVGGDLALARRWEATAARLAQVRDRLAQAAGGLDAQGRPRDVAEMVAGLQSALATAQRTGLRTDPAPQALAQGRAFLALQYPQQLEQHDAVVAAVRAALATIQHRLDARVRADQLLSRLPGLLDQATSLRVTGDAVARADRARADVQAAEREQDDVRMDQAVAELQQAVDGLAGAVDRARQLGGCIAEAPDRLIVVHLASQRLVAYDHGCPFLAAPVTTGRPQLPTDRGTFHIFAKYPAYHMVSPWPRGSPFYYNPAWVYDAMEFVPDGTFLHSAPWEPASAYGPGSEYGPYASHGCVHVPDGPLRTLYAWATIGTTVVVED